jgi:hypothetical protein
VFGVFKPRVKQSYARAKIIKQQRKAGKDVIVLETGYVNRGDGPNDYYAAGWNGLNGRADFKNKGMGSARWEGLGVKMAPPTQGEDIILCGQVPWDASVVNVNIVDWLNEVSLWLSTVTSRKVVYRPHPKAKEHPKEVAGAETSAAALQEDLDRAFCVVTYNSNAAVLAVLAGVPATAEDKGSMASLVTGDRRQILHPPHPTEGVRQQWANDLAYAQWNLDEMRGGMAWEHLIG